MKTNVFLVQSPMQMLSAIEAAICSKEAENILIVKFSSKERIENNKQIIRLLNFYDWSRVVHLNTCGKSTFLSHLLRRSLLRKVKSDYGEGKIVLYIGDFRSEWMHQVRSVTLPKETFLLDDGAVTVNIQADFLAKGINQPEFAVKSKLRKILKKIIYFKVDSKFNLNSPINLFTSFDVNSHKNQVIRNHNYENVMRLLSKGGEKTGEEFIFFGSKYSEAGIIDFNTEIKMLSQIKEYLKFTYGINELTYIAHRDDSKEKLLYLEKEVGLYVNKLDFPAEVYLLQRKVTPKCIAGFYTSVLPNAKKLMPSIQVLSFKIPSDDLNPKNKASIKEVYSFYESINIKVIGFPLFY